MGPKLSTVPAIWAEGSGDSHVLAGVVTRDTPPSLGNGPRNAADEALSVSLRAGREGESSDVRSQRRPPSGLDVRLSACDYVRVGERASMPVNVCLRVNVCQCVHVRMCVAYK